MNEISWRRRVPRKGYATNIETGRKMNLWIRQFLTSLYQYSSLFFCSPGIEWPEGIR